MEGRRIDLTVAPDWRRVPVQLLDRAGYGQYDIELQHDPTRIAPVAPEVTEMVKQFLLPHENAKTFFNGEYANVEGITINPVSTLGGHDRLIIETGVARAFPYIASAWHYRNDPGANPIRPLAVQTVVFNHRLDNILVERRPADIVDHPLKLSVLGGALKPGEDPKAGALRCLAKWGIELDPDVLSPLALSHEPADRIYCVSYLASLPDSQIQQAINATVGKRNMLILVCDGWKNTCRSILSSKRGDHPIHDWNPLGFSAFLAGVAQVCDIGDAEVTSFLQQVYQVLEQIPFRYTFPMERYLSDEQQI